MRSLRRIPLLALALALPACTSFGPAVRSPGYGAPGRLRQGQLELGGGVAVPGGYGPGAGGPYLAYAVRDWANVEIGADFNYRTWALGYLGGRFTHAPNRDKKLHYALDGELGVGMGAGGSLHCGGPNAPLYDCDGRRWTDRFAVGAYAGGGAGYHFSWFALFARGRVQATLADGLPGTVYTALHGGMQFRIARRVDLHASGGIFNLHPGAFSRGVQPYWDVGLSVYFDVPRKRKPTARAAPLLSL